VKVSVQRVGNEERPAICSKKQTKSFIACLLRSGKRKIVSVATIQFIKVFLNRQKKKKLFLLNKEWEHLCSFLGNVHIKIVL